LRETVEIILNRKSFEDRPNEIEGYSGIGNDQGRQIGLSEKIIKWSKVRSFNNKQNELDNLTLEMFMNKKNYKKYLEKTNYLAYIILKKRLEAVF
jgi:hypothetical protein